MEEEADGLSQPLWQMQPGKEAPRRPSLEAFELLVDWRTEIGKGFLRFCFFSKNSLLDSKRTLFFAPNNALTLFFRLETKIKKRDGKELAPLCLVQRDSRALCRLPLVPSPLTMGSCSREDVWARLSAAADASSATTAADEQSQPASTNKHSAAVSLWRDLAEVLSADPGA